MVNDEPGFEAIQIGATSDLDMVASRLTCEGPWPGVLGGAAASSAAAPSGSAPASTSFGVLSMLLMLACVLVAMSSPK